MKMEAVDIQNNRGFQEIKIPDSLKINDNKVYIKKIGNGLYIIPFHNPWENLFDSLQQFTTDFMEDRKQPSQQSRESFD
jgi:antitoxin VapB